MKLPKFDASSYAFTPYTDVRNWVGGRWADAASGESMEVINPRYGRAMGRVQMSGAADVDAAVSSAQAAFGPWSEWPMRERAQILFRLKGLVERDREELSWLVSHENGKTIEQARASVDKGIECIEFGTSLPQLAAGGQLDVSRGVNCKQVHAPLGVCAGVTPFNFPFMVPLWMLPQALVGGNCFVLKPSEQVPYSTVKLAELLQEAGLPDGVFNLVNGARPAVEALADHPGISAMAFVGSTRVAKLVYGRGAETGKRMLCLGGAKNHLIVVPDADYELTVENVTASFTGCAGQRCMAAAVLVAVGDVDHLIDGIAKRASELRLGIDMGAINSAASVERIRRYVDDAESKGATVLTDGRGQSANDEGYWMGPTVVDGVTPDMPAAREEIFGPVLTVLRVNSVDEAIALENANPYGNASSIYTTSGEVARYVTERVEAGMVGVNIGVPVPREPFGFGGWNDSKFGHGNITGWDGFRFWTRPRKITTKWALQKDWTWMS
jgi:malonate-semialdehyde dehydrogenase (acetylating)/methylmalonate-semialdehyde dehydrogenase